MKARIGIFVAAVLALTVSCAPLDEPQIETAGSEVSNGDHSKAIGYSLVGTKAIVSDVTDVERDERGISIFAKATKDAASSDIFSNARLVYSQDNWTYRKFNPIPIQYMESGYLYDFVSIYPYHADGFTETTGQVKFDAATQYFKDGNYDEEDQVDWMAHGYSVASDDTETGIVPIVLNHCCANVQFELANNFGCDISITEVSLFGIYENGTCTVKSDNTIGWSAQSVIVDANGSTASDFRSDAMSESQPLVINKGESAPLYSHPILAIPQTSSGDVTVKVVFTDGSGQSKTRTANLGRVTWQNKEYNYQLTINDEIDIIVVNEKVWTSVSWKDLINGAGVIVGQPTSLEVYVYFPDGAKTTGKVTIDDQEFQEDTSGDEDSTKDINGKIYTRYYLNNYVPQLNDASVGENKQIFASAEDYETKSANKVLPVWGILPATNPTTSQGNFNNYVSPATNLYIVKEKSSGSYLYNTGSSLAGEAKQDYSALFGLKGTKSKNAYTNFTFYSPRTDNYLIGNDSSLSFGKTGTSYSFYTDNQKVFGILGKTGKAFIFFTTYFCLYMNSNGSCNIVEYGPIGSAFVGDKVTNIQDYSFYPVTLVEPSSN